MLLPLGRNLLGSLGFGLGPRYPWCYPSAQLVQQSSRILRLLLRSSACVAAAGAPGDFGGELARGDSSVRLVHQVRTTSQWLSQQQSGELATMGCTTCASATTMLIYGGSRQVGGRMRACCNAADGATQRLARQAWVVDGGRSWRVHGVDSGDSAATPIERGPLRHGCPLGPHLTTTKNMETAVSG